MDGFEHKTLVTKPYDLTYSYYVSPNFKQSLKPDVPTLIFCHGYPDDAYMWAGAMPHMLKSPYPIILIDILGLGKTSKPTEAKMYNYKQQADSIIQIVDAEKVPGKIIPIGHDWGSGISQRLYLWHKDRCVGLTLLSLAYVIPTSQPFDLDEQNKATAGRFGYPQWEYWNFFCAEDAPKLMEEDLMRMWEVNNGNYPSHRPREKGRDIWMREMFCTLGAMREYVAKQGKYKDFTVDLKPYAKEKALQEAFLERMKNDGFSAPVQYYHSLASNTMLEEEKELSSSKQRMSIEVPMLYIGQTGDWVCRTDLMSDAKDAGLISDIEEKVIDAGHWCLYEKPQEIAEIISEWLAKKFPVES